MALGTSKPVVTKWVLDNKGVLVNVAKQAKAIRMEQKAERELALVTKKLGLAMDSVERSSKKVEQATGAMSKGFSVAKGAAANLVAEGMMVLKDALIETIAETNIYIQASAIYTGNIGAARKATRGLAADTDIMVAKNRLMTLGVKMTDAEFNKMLASLTKISGAMSIDLKFALESATTMLARQSTAVADNVGVVIKAEEAYKKFAKAQGIVGRQLTANEKKLAFQREAIEQLTTKAGELNDRVSTTSDEFIRLQNVLKSAVVNVTSAIMRWKPLIKLMEGLTGGAQKLADEYAKLTGGKREGKFEHQEKVEALNKVRKEIAQTRKELAGFNRELLEKGGGGFFIPGAEKALRANIKAWKRDLETLKAREAQAQKNVNANNRHAESIKKVAKARSFASIGAADPFAGGRTGPSELYGLSGAQSAMGKRGKKRKTGLALLPPLEEKLPTAEDIFGKEGPSPYAQAAVDMLKLTDATQKKIQADVGAEAAAQRHAVAMGALKVEMQDMAVGALTSFTSGIWAAADASIAGSESFGMAMAKMLKSTLLNIATESTIKGTLALAEYAFSGFTAVPKLKAAGMYFATAAIAGGAGLGVSGGIKSAGGYSSSSGSSASKAKTTAASSYKGFGTRRKDDKRPIIVNIDLKNFHGNKAAARLAAYELEATVQGAAA